MISESSLTARIEWQQQARKYLEEESYSLAANLYEQAINAEPDVKSHYWHLGLMLLLQGKEEEAHTTWLLGMVEGEPEEVDQWTEELIQVLQAEAERQEALKNYRNSWLIRQHLREIAPGNINNLLYLIQLSIELGTLSGDELNEWGIIEILRSQPPANLDFDLLMQVLRRVLDSAPLHPFSLELVKVSLAYIREPIEFLKVVLPAAVTIAYVHRRPELAARLAEIYLEIDANNLEVLRQLSIFYQNACDFDKGIETAKLCYSLLEKIPDKVYANYLLLRGLMGAGGYWQEAQKIGQRQESLLSELIEAQPKNLSEIEVLRLVNTSFFLPYFSDRAQRNRQLQNKLAELCQINAEIYAKEKVERYRARHCQWQQAKRKSEPIKIGYLSHCLRRHSVGWLARWLLEYHDRERFQINGYFLTQKWSNDPLEEWYVSKMNKAYHSAEGLDVAEQIYGDEIEILIDLDSITLDTSCEVMMLKPAPVQVTWLGWDASGIPAIDYFIADPYVLPESAGDYYAEKIWRLPHTFIAVDGFEIDVPTLRRDQLDIPSDAVVYLSSQKGYKRHPDTVRLQMKIIKEVPNSYFLIKGTADEKAIKSFFMQLAEEEGVECERLRFLSEVALESVHRANLGIADVVLDTYPYNGATTTLETLWMGVPLVTRVGEQFSARNSYSMMMNVGVKEGIAWSAEEYVEWGVRLGKDPELRKEISWRLRQSRHTSPLWNGRQFAREMEKAYEQMWQRFIENQ
ncbi:MAG: O-linked N-acetylglucosamine transferase, SPINDLY family protein [Oscillatoriaceae bacterium SKW80]|nr:O-linked N-acetylglucosamine transferase, SPINDLY family protein [Oscillatoriaceae bacterium SKYG93]MCX8121861.1 O-linked N-acetylglucosamine transferase, SPINDLY family protein [Oscillatoriaceae bacterium SKW80]MDW8454622.1 O-linked N-acetylglucosamine transferase, SPINDLY family protein [Oscillatoriaceae cyanobacterium SKYGB_i_bin93]HIK27432.1 O-linked N-acetylglucosamine transferase, SPINDLY family protein [Oscillatoriaceae cyanobacterium M7585_C2015_266]